jgi:hypothetical protein
LTRLGLEFRELLLPKGARSICCDVSAMFSIDDIVALRFWGEEASMNRSQLRVMDARIAYVAYVDAIREISLVLFLHALKLLT